MRPRKVQTRLGGALGDVQRCCDLFDTQLFEIVQRQRGSVGAAELAQRFLKSGDVVNPPGCCVLSVVECLLALDESIVGVSMALSTPGPVGAFERDDAVRPGGKSGSVVQSAQPANNGEPGFLRCVGRRVGVAREPVGVAVQPRLPAFDQFGQGVLLTLLAADHQPLIVN